MTFKQIPPPNYDYNTGKLVKAYKKAIRDIERELKSLPIGDIRQAHAKVALANVAKILSGINKECEVWVNENVPIAAKDGVARTLVSLGEVKTLEEALEIAKFNRMNKALVDAVIADTYTDLLAVTQNVDRKTRVAVRKAVSESMRANMATGIMGRKTINTDTLKQIQNTLDSATSTGIIDAVGRRWSPSVYVDMVTRTKLMQTHIEATTNEAVSRDVTYFVVSSHSGACQKCIPWEGRVLALDSNNEYGFPTIDDARSGGLFHPNCSHVITALRQPNNLPDDLRKLNKLR